MVQYELSKKDFTKIISKYVFELHELYELNKYNSYINISENTTISKIWNDLKMTYRSYYDDELPKRYYCSKIEILGMEIHINPQPQYIVINNLLCINSSRKGKDGWLERDILKFNESIRLHNPVFEG